MWDLKPTCTDEILELYRTNDYILKNPSMHEEDTPWKITKILPLIDICMTMHEGKEFNLLDVGGGAGLILKEISFYIEQKYGKKVNKYALDLSPGMLNAQRINNPDLILGLLEDICSTSLKDKQIDLALMIDVIEHIPDPKKAMEQLRRISHYVIYKVPLESNLVMNGMNLVTMGKARRNIIKNIGHINVYRPGTLRRKIKRYNGEIVSNYYTNVYNYYNTNTSIYKRISLLSKIIYYICEKTHKITPGLTAFVSLDYMMLLVKCF